MNWRQFLGLATAGVMCSVGPAQAVPVTSSTSSLVTFRDCVAGVTVCDDITAAQNFYAGLPGDTSTQNNQTDGVRAVDSSAELTSAGGALLQAAVNSAPSTREGANLQSLQRYTYNGAVARTLTFFGHMAYDQTVPAENADFPFAMGTATQAYGYIEAFVIDDANFDAGVTAQDNYWALFGSWGFAPGYVSLGFDEFTGPQVSGAGTHDLAVSFSVNPGQSVWLFSFFQAVAANDAEVEGSLRTAIPEPGTLALAALSLAGLAVTGRRRRQTA